MWNYDSCLLSVKDYLWSGAAAALILSVISYTFYDSAAVFMVLFLPGWFFLLRKRSRSLPQKRKELLKKQFLTAATLLGDYLKSGHSVENAIGSSVSELTDIWGEDADIVREWRQMAAGLRLNRPAEEVFDDFAERSGISQIRDFSEVFRSVNRGSGQLGYVISNVTAVLSMQFHTEEQIETMIASKKYEQKMMDLIPAAILCYIRLASPELLQPMYGTVTGRIVMTGCLAVYLLAVLWARKIGDICV